MLTLEDFPTTKNEEEIKFLTFGSPIIDVIVDVDKNFIKKHNLKLDTTSHASKTDCVVFSEIENFNPTYVAGGCSYNAIRVMNWMMKASDEKGKVGCLGAVGDDFYGNLYYKLLEHEGIVPIFERIPSMDSGKCATLCENRERCHLTDLGASIKISEDFVDSCWNEIKNVKLIYTELYILSHRPTILNRLANLCLDDSKIFGFNLPSIGFLDAFSKQIIEIISYGDVLFANKEEAKHFVTNVLKTTYTNTSELALILAKLPKKNKKKSRVFVVTCGPETAYVAVYNHESEKVEFEGGFDPFDVPTKLIVDTNGAGDAFAGGFLAYYVQDKPLISCFKAGHWAAKQIIKVRGCDIPYEIKTPNEQELLKFDKEETIRKLSIELELEVAKSNDVKDK